jgi:DNA-binding Xre family transcriptional regulator
MAFCYKKLWHQLIDHDMSRTDLRDATGMAPATLAKLSKGEAVGTPTLEKICRVLQCNIGDIMDYVPETHRIQGDNDGDNLGRKELNGI